MNPLIVITGGTKGIGQALVERFAVGGFDIVTCARQADDLANLQNQIATNYPNVAIYAKTADVAQKQDVLDFGAYVLALARPVAVLINNAGVFAAGQLHNEPEGVLEQMIETNLYSTYHLTRALVPNMITAQKGHIFNLCSTASITAYANGGSYCVSKFALYGLTKVFREELKPHGIKVTAILPGATLTASWEGVELPPERFMQAQDVAEVIWSAYHLSAGAVVEELIMRPQLGDIG
jgi:short-subunit dehydrogenase